MYTREAKNSLPSTKDDLATVYTTLEENEVFVRNNQYVTISGNDTQYLLHQFKKANSNRDDKIKVRIDLKSSLAPSTSTIYLQAWNGITNSWETVDSNSLLDADTDFSLMATLNALDGNYYDFRESSAEVCFRVYQLNNGGGARILSIDLVQISFVPVYQSAYNSQPSSYSPKYPHQNPQDDNNII